MKKEFLPKDLDDLLKSFSVDNVFNAIQSSGKSRNISDFPLLQYYLTDVGFYPHVKNYNEISLNHVKFTEEFEKLTSEILFKKENCNQDNFNIEIEQIIYKLGKGYFAEVSLAYSQLDNYEFVLQSELKKLSSRDQVALVSNLNILCPPDNSPFKNLELENQIFDLVKKYSLSKNTTSTSIGMICSDDGDYYMKDFYLKKDYSIVDGDLHYGKGFDNFHAQLLERFKTDSKGLVLLHGIPGSGKTHFCRSLLKQLGASGKYVIYLPPNMVDNLIDPNMMTFLSATVLDKAEQGKSCILLLEDAESLLVARTNEGRSSGITNLLNITDGILNDMLSIQVIATFNTTLSNIDKALLRPERLIARKEFKKLSKEDAQILANKLGMDKKIEEPSTLAEIYSNSKGSEILIHEYDEVSTKIGFNR